MSADTRLPPSFAAPAKTAPPAAPPTFRQRAQLWFVGFKLGGRVIGTWAALLGTVLLTGFLVVLFVTLLAVSGLGIWVFLFAVGAAVLATWAYLSPDPNEPGEPQAPLPKQRPAGIYGDACYATFAGVQAMGLFPNSFAAAIYLGEFLNWYAPDGTDFVRTGHHLGYVGENNLLTVAPAGTGKFTTTIGPTLMLNTQSMVVLDVKGQAFAVTAAQRQARLGHRVIAVNPFNLFGDLLGADSGIQSHYNPLGKLDYRDERFTAQIDALAASLIVQDGTELHFPARARDLVACLMAHVCSDPAELAAGNNTLPRVRQILGLPREEFAAYMIAARENPLPRVQNLAGGFTDPESREIASIISTAIGQLGFLDQPMIAAFLSKSDFDFAALRTAPTTVYLMLPPNELNTYPQFARLMVQSCLNALSVEPKEGDRSVLLILDEQAQLKRMESVSSAIALLRGYRVRIWSIFQDLSQIESLYGNRWESFVANAGIVQLFTTNDEKTAKYFSAKAGNCTGTAEAENEGQGQGFSTPNAPGQGGSRNQNTSFGKSRTPVGVPFLSPQAFYSLPDWQSVFFVRGARDTVPGLKQHYWTLDFLKGCYLPDPYHDAAGFKQQWQAHRLMQGVAADLNSIDAAAPQEAV